MKKEKRTPYTDALFDVRLSIRYHERRQGFFDGVLKLSMFFTLVLNSSAVGLILSQVGEFWTILAMLTGTVMLAGSLAYGVRDKSSQHEDLRRRFIKLEQEIRAKNPTDETATWAEIERLAIEADEPSASMTTVVAICHNEESKAQGGFDEEDFIKVTPMQKALRHLVNWKEDTLKLPETA